ncbi:leukocidin family pore-forming toxin [Moritella viscosa]
MTWDTFDGPIRGYNRCENANISLIYKVNLLRSLQFGTQGSLTPDAKIVRISIDDSTQGAGIHLNNRLAGSIITSRGIPWPEGGNEAEFVTTAIAKNYDFNFTAQNAKAKVLRTLPSKNLNANYTHKETSTFNIGISGGVEADKSGPKIKLDANMGWSESKWLTFDTRYSNAESIRNVKTHGISADIGIPANLSLINPIGYASFKPQIEVIYKASPRETGTTDIIIDSAVDITGFRYRSSVTGLFGVRTYYSNDSDNQTSRVSKKETIIVDWDHPVFTGGRPVNLQLAHFNNKCISTDNKQNVTIQTCEESSHQQAFIYSRTGQYVSARNTDLCLDAKNLGHLQICNLRVSQRWEWKEGTEQLQNKRYKTYLGHNKTTGKLSLISDEDSDTSIELYTSYVDVFH